MFQSGAESSSPTRPPPKPRVRKSAAPKVVVPTRRSTRKVSAPPPERLPSSSPRASDDEEAPSVPQGFSPARSTKFEPQLSPEVVRENQRYGSPGAPRPSSVYSPFVSPFKKQQGTPFRPISSPVPAQDEIIPDSDPERELELEREREQEEEEEEEEEDQLFDETDDAKQVRVIGEAIARGSPSSSASATEVMLPIERPPSVFSRIIFVLFLALGVASVWPYKTQSASIGFCDAGSNTNEVLETIRTRTAAVEACQRENRTTLYIPPAGANISGLDECPTVLESALPAPDSCTPCPDHAICHHTEVNCTNGFIIRSHPFLSFLSLPPIHSLNLSSPPTTLPAPTQWALEAVSVTLDGLPRLGPVAFPPRCVEDPRRKKHINIVGKNIEAHLGQTRGTRVCAGKAKPFKDEMGGEARMYGIETRELHDMMKKNTEKNNAPVRAIWLICAWRIRCAHLHEHRRAYR
jgi:hypothetical protein